MTRLCLPLIAIGWQSWNFSLPFSKPPKQFFKFVRHIVMISLPARILGARIHASSPLQQLKSKCLKSCPTCAMSPCSLELAQPVSLGYINSATPLLTFYFSAKKAHIPIIPKTDRFYGHESIFSFQKHPKWLLMCIASRSLAIPPNPSRPFFCSFC
jgi:hypothetical protein